jgi:long-chain fatty acid transport protein
MRKATVTIFLCVLCVGCLTLPVLGGGLGISAVGAKAKAMGGAFRAIADDWSAAYYNPAGIFYITENQLTFNEVITHYRPTYTPDVTFGGYDVGFYEGEIYSKYKILTNPTMGGFIKLPLEGSGMMAGLALFQPFDHNMSWELFKPLNNGAALPGQQIEHNFDAVAIGLVGAFELMEDKVSAGFSIGVIKSDLSYGSFFLRPNPASEDSAYHSQIASRPNNLITEWQKSEGRGVSPLLRTGIFIKASPRVNIGLTYAMESRVTIEGDSYLYYYMPDIPFYNSRSDVNTARSSIDYILSSGARYEAEAEFETDITLPAQFGIGLSYQVTDKLLVAGDLEYTMWSEFDGYIFDYAFEDTSITLNSDLNAWMVKDVAAPVKWNDIFKLSLGARYQYSDVIQLRAGYMADQTPVEEGTLTPAFYDPGLKNTFSLGLGLTFENVILDLATGYTAYDESKEVGHVDLNSQGIYDGISDNYGGTYGGSVFESIIQFTVRF